MKESMADVWHVGQQITTDGKRNAKWWTNFPHSFAGAAQPILHLSAVAINKRVSSASLSLRLRCSAWLPPSPPDWDGSNGGGGEAPPPPPRPGDVGGVRRGGQPPLQAGRRRAALRQQGRPFPQPQVRPSVRLSIFLISIFPVPIPTTNLYEYQFNL